MSSERKTRLIPTHSTFGKRRLVKRTGKVIDKREKFKIIIDGKDYTPKPLMEGEIVQMDETIPAVEAIFGGISVSGASSAFMGSGGLKSKIAGSSHDVSISQMVESSIQELETSKFDEVRDSSRDIEEKAPSQFLLPKFPYVKSPPVPTELVITLKETPTFFLFDRPSVTELDGTVEGDKAKQANVQYLARLEEAQKSVSKKVTDMNTQTPVVFWRNQATMATRCERNNSATNVTTYDIYKTNRLLRKMKKHSPSSNIVEDPLKSLRKGKDMETDSAFGDSEMREGSRRKMTTDSSISESFYSEEGSTKHKESDVEELLSGEQEDKGEDKLVALFQSKKFQNAVFFIERILAGNVFDQEQKIFKGITRQDEFRLDVDFKYTLGLLWTYTNEVVSGRSVTSLSWNKINENLLAVGYGKYYYRDKRGGMVCCWCIKNPVQPERTYKFDTPVQCVDFGTLSPNLLAVGFYNGDVAVLDISSRTISIVARNDRDTMTSFAPLWDVKWVRGEDEYKDEHLMTAGQDGRIFKYVRGITFMSFPMMRITRSEGKVRGVQVPRKCDPHDIPITCHPPALVIASHPGNHIIYLVGTGEGGIHKCSINYLYHHLEMFLAHRGPVYGLRFSPFSNTIFMTCGADFCVRVWADGVGDPLFTLSVTGSRDPVLDVSWSPINATIIASISGSQVHIWDISRKIAAPVATIDSPSKIKNSHRSRLSTVRFTKSGDNLVVGDIQGNVHLFAMKDMPFSPFFPEEALLLAVIKALATRPDLYKELRKTYPNFEELMETHKKSLP